MPACGGNQYTVCDTAQGCIYCGHKELKKMRIEEDEDWRNLGCRLRAGEEKCYVLKAIARTGV